MADVIYKGFYQALEAGQLANPDIRLALFMSGFSYDPDSVHLSDGALDEFDGAGYSRHDAQDVTTGYVDGSNEWQLSFDSGTGGEFGDPVAAGSEAVAGLVAYLHIDGTAANDIILASTTTGGFGVNANNGPLSLTLPADGLLFARAA
ncbi:MAG: hypothetical protein WCE98_11550 [Chlorobium sp.]